MRLVAALCLAGAAAIAPRGATKALSVRGGTFCEIDAKQAGEQCGIEAPERAVVKTIRGAVLFPLKVLGIRGGADAEEEEEEESEAEAEKEEADEEDELEDIVEDFH
jgi:hypothetical protein